MTTRRDFLTRLARTAAGLYVADDALEAILEPRRKLWPGASFGEPTTPTYDAMRLDDLTGLMHDIFVRRVVTDIQMESHTAMLFGQKAEFKRGDLSGNCWTERVTA